jgi:hypothetical protein
VLSRVPGTGASRSDRPRGAWRSAGALLAGFVAIFALSLATDQLFHVLEVFPPWGEPMRETGDNVLALSYRLVWNVAGCYLAARAAPYAPMGHALVLGAIGVVFASLGALAAIRMDLGPIWYPVALVLSALPCAWLGGALARARRS